MNFISYKPRKAVVGSYISVKKVNKNIDKSVIVKVFY